MKNIGQWKRGKFVYRGGKLSATRDASELAVPSRLMATMIARKYQDAIPRYCSGRLLDLGCGKAPLYEAYREYVTEIEMADWEASLHCNPCIDHFIDLAGPIPLESGSYNTVILSDVLEHIPEPAQLMGEIHRLLAGNGVLLLNVPFYYWVHEAPHDYYRYTAYALERLATLAGFKVEQIEPLGGAVEVMADVVSKSLGTSKSMAALRPLVALIQRAAILFSGTGVGRRISGRTSGFFPFGYFAVFRKSGL